MARIASREVSIASPTAVAPSGTRPSMLRFSAARSVVGETSRLAWPEKLTRPTWYWRGTSSAKVSAASCAARSRYGLTSVAAMEPETSTTSMIVARSRGLVAVGLGPGEREGEGRQREEREREGQVTAHARAGIGPRRPCRCRGRGRPRPAGGGATRPRGRRPAAPASSASRKMGCWKLMRRAILRRMAGRPSERASGSTHSSPVCTMTWRAPARESMDARARSVASTVAAKRLWKRGSAVSTRWRRPVSRSRRCTGPTLGRSRSRGIAHLDGDQLVAAARAPRWRARGPAASGKSEIRITAPRCLAMRPERRDGAHQVGAARPLLGRRCGRWRPAPRSGRGGPRAAGAPGRCHRRAW